MKFAVNNDADVSRKLQHIMAWMENKRTATINEANPERVALYLMFLYYNNNLVY